jgi:hypothetical protein
MSLFDTPLLILRPYEVRKEGNKYCVHKKAGGKSLGCHASRAEAQDQIAAIYANEKRSVTGLLRRMVRP